MGPRSVDRGRHLPVRQAYASDMQLQWGHDLLIVEGVQVFCQGDDADISFNGATIC